jgi:hypothetical protein
MEPRTPIRTETNMSSAMHRVALEVLCMHSALSYLHHAQLCNASVNGTESSRRYSRSPLLLTDVYQPDVMTSTGPFPSLSVYSVPQLTTTHSVINI